MSVKGRICYIAMRDGQDYPAVCVRDEDATTLTIWFMNADKIIFKSDIKSIQPKGQC